MGHMSRDVQISASCKRCRFSILLIIDARDDDTDLWFCTKCRTGEPARYDSTKPPFCPRCCHPMQHTPRGRCPVCHKHMRFYVDLMSGAD
jgi:hypothetical protein